MGKIVPSWQTSIDCQRDSLNIRHLKSGLAEDLSPLSQYGRTLDTVTMEGCEIAQGALSVLAGASSLRCLCLKNCGLSDEDFDWFSESPASPYQAYQVVDMEQITRKKFYVYSERDDRFLSQYRCLVVQTEE